MRDCLDDGVLQSYFDDELSSTRRESVMAHLATCQKCAAAARELENENSVLATALAPEFDAAVPTTRLRERIDSAIRGGQIINVERPSRQWLQSFSALFSFTPQRTFGYASVVVILALIVVFAVIRLRESSHPLAVNNTLPETTPAVAPSPAAPPKEVFPPAPVVAALPKSPTPGYRISSVPSVREKGQVARVKLLPGERGYLKTIAALDSTIKGEVGRPMRPSLRAEYERNLALVDRALAAARSAAKSNPNDPDAAEFMFSAYQSKVDLLNTVADARINNRQ